MIEVLVRDPFSTLGLEKLAQKAARAALDYEGQPTSVDLTVVLSDDAEVSDLNHRFMGIDSPTDVLSFPSDEVDPESGARYLGDIILSIPRAMEQANQGKHPLEAEIQLLIVHGVLHLLGYDHVEQPDQEKMWSVQADILKEMGSPLQFPAE